MRRIFLVVLLVLPFFIIEAQENKVETLISHGNRLVEQELYEDALGKYKEALSIDKSSERAIYELAYVYFLMKKDEAALDYCHKAIRLNGSKWVDANLLYASILERKGEVKDAIKVLEKALRRDPHNYLLHYNLGSINYNAKELDKAAWYFEQSIRENRLHSSSHLLLAYTMIEKEEYAKGVLALYYFLLLEPDSYRSNATLSMLENLWNINALKLDLLHRKKQGKVAKENQKFVQLGKSYVSSWGSESSDEKTDLESLIVHTNDLMEAMNGISDIELDIWNLVYFDLFKVIHEKGYTESFVYLIGDCKYNTQILEKISEHPQDFRAFAAWMEVTLESLKEDHN
ncbi:tetratricopeptide repeat protein [Marinilabiliaceae bacterium JC017]|nr:tetratricopeptide repeat protein [Marinilabiliaceae bacterium JC017]